MNDLLKYLYNSEHKNIVDIKFEDQFWNEEEVKYLVSKLVKHGVVSIKDENYNRIQVKVEQPIYSIAKDFDFDLDKYIQSKQKQPPIINHGNINFGNAKGHINQSFESRSHSLPNLKPAYDMNSKSNKNKTAGEIFKTIFQYLAWIAGISTAILAIYKFAYLKL
jgi:hypothetical protein